MNLADLTYNEAGLTPASVQDANTHEVLMMAWMNEEAVRRTLEEKTTWFWSRSRNKFWHKGEESGNTQELVDLRYDCDEDTLLALRESRRSCLPHWGAHLLLPFVSQRRSAFGALAPATSQRAHESKGNSPDSPTSPENDTAVAHCR